MCAFAYQSSVAQWDHQRFEFGKGVGRAVLFVVANMAGQSPPEIVPQLLCGWNRVVAVVCERNGIGRKLRNGKE